MPRRPIELRLGGGDLFLLVSENGVLEFDELGPIEQAGDEIPEELRAEYERLLDEWRHGFDPRAEAEASWRIAKGM